MLITVLLLIISYTGCTDLVDDVTSIQGQHVPVSEPIVAVVVDTTKNVRAINPMIYGVHNAQREHFASLKYPLSVVKQIPAETNLTNLLDVIKQNGAVALLTASIIGNGTHSYTTVHPAYIANQMQFLSARGTPVTFWALDNDPELWETRRNDVWYMSVKYAAAMKSRQPSAKIFGPIVLNNYDLLPWYARQVCTYKRARGLQLVDYLDVAMPSADQQAYILYLRKVVKLCPAMKIAITEWKLDNDDTVSGAVANAEALAIFGREGVDVAARWQAPHAGSRGEDAFRMYLDYNCQRDAIHGNSVKAISSNAELISAYAIHSQSTDQVFVILFNKHEHRNASTFVSICVQDAPDGTVTLYGFDDHNSYRPRGSTTISDGTFTVTTLHPSATIAVVNMVAEAQNSNFRVKPSGFVIVILWIAAAWTT